MVAAITSKLDDREDGNISAAVRLLCSEDNPAEFITANLEKLQDKHPQEYVDARTPLTPENVPGLQASEDAVLKAIRSFRRVPHPVPMVFDLTIYSNLCIDRKMVLISSSQ